MAIIYKNFVLLDGTERMIPQSGLALVIINGRIVKLCKESELDLKKMKAVDLGGRYLMPGLVNVAVQTIQRGNQSNSPQSNKSDATPQGKGAFYDSLRLSQMKKNLRAELYSGTMSVCTISGVGSFDTEIKKKIDSGSIIGPRILSSNMTIAINGLEESSAINVCSNEEAKQATSRLLSEGVDFIKIDIPVLSSEEETAKASEIIKTICEEAHSTGKKVSARVDNNCCTKVAIDSGVDNLGNASEIDSEDLKLMMLRRSSLICSFSSVLSKCLAKEKVEIEAQNRTKERIAEIALTAKQAIANGVKVGLGSCSGAPYSTHYGMWREIEYFKKYLDVSAEFALHSATLKNAEIMGIDKETGSIAEGKSADILVIDKNPLEDFEAISKPFLVVFRGKEYILPKVKRDNSVENKLNDFRKKYII